MKNTKKQIIKDIEKEISEIEVLPEANTESLFGKIRIFFIKLLVGKKSIMINCKLINSETVVNNNCTMIKNTFVYGKNCKNRVEGLTIKPRKTEKKVK